MSDWGVFAVARDIWEHPVLGGDEPFSKREAWMWILSAAAWKPYRTGFAGRVVSLERGEFCFAVRFLEKKWRWSKSRVARFLDVLEKQDMIRDTSRDSVKIYFVSNYDEYQVVGLPKRDSERDDKRDATGTAAGQQRDKEETLKHSNIEDTSSLRSDVVPAQPIEPQAVLVLEPVREIATVTELPAILDRTEEGAAFQAYNAAADEMGWPKAQRLNDARRRSLKLRLRECGGVDGWREAMAKARASPFLSGTGPRGKGYENWTPDLDYFLQPSTFTKLMEGKYDERLNAGSNNGFSSPVFTGAASAIARRRRARETGEGLEGQADYGAGAPIAAGGTG